MDIPCPITWCKTTVISDTIYLADHSDRLKIFTYLPGKDEWAFLSEEKYPPASYFGMAVVKEQLILAGGGDFSNKKPTGVNVISVWDTNTKEWTHPYPAMSKVRYDPYAVGWGKYLVVAGGQNGSEGVSSIEILDTERSTWLTAGQTPVKMVSSLSLVKDTLYLAGDGAKVFTASLPEIVSHMTSGDAASLPWKPLPDTPLQQVSLYTMSDRLFSAGGVDPDTNKSSSSILVFDGKTWCKAGDLPEPNIECCCSPFSPLGGLLVVGGKTSVDQPYLLQSVNIGKCS